MKAPKLKRKTIGAGWYSFDLPGGSRAGARFLSKGNWGYYFRGPNNEHLDINGREGVGEYRGPSYDYAVERIKEFMRGPVPSGRNDKVLTLIAAAINGAGLPLAVEVPAEAVYDVLLKKGLLRLDAFEAN